MYSSAAEQLPRFDQVLALGRKLVEELDLESTDTLGRWMAHYVAELMDRAESSALEELAAAKKRCSDVILDLWSHRAELPDGKRPFEELEPIMRAIESLDPENEAPRYVPFQIDAADEAEEDSRTRALIEVIRNIDTSARILIGQMLVDAASCALEQSKDWVILAQTSGFEMEREDVLVRLVSGEYDVDTDPNPRKRKRNFRQGRIDRLEAFIDMAKLAVEDLKKMK